MPLNTIAYTARLRLNKCRDVKLVFTFSRILILRPPDAFFDAPRYFSPEARHMRRLFTFHAGRILKIYAVYACRHIAHLLLAKGFDLRQCHNGEKISRRRLICICTGKIC